MFSSALTLIATILFLSVQLIHSRRCSHYPCCGLPDRREKQEDWDVRGIVHGEEDRRCSDPVSKGLSITPRACGRQQTRFRIRRPPRGRVSRPGRLPAAISSSRHSNFSRLVRGRAPPSSPRARSPPANATRSAIFLRVRRSPPPPGNLHERSTTVSFEENELNVSRQDYSVLFEERSVAGFVLNTGSPLRRQQLLVAHGQRSRTNRTFYMSALHNGNCFLARDAHNRIGGQEQKVIQSRLTARLRFREFSTLCEVWSILFKTK